MGPAHMLCRTRAVRHGGDSSSEPTLKNRYDARLAGRVSSRQLQEIDSTSPDCSSSSSSSDGAAA